jgi:hypothetical protein
MRRYFFEVLAVALIGGSLFFFKETLDYLARRDYVAAVLVMVIGVAVISVGKEMARLALVQRDCCHSPCAQRCCSRSPPAEARRGPPRCRRRRRPRDRRRR